MDVVLGRVVQEDEELAKELLAKVHCVKVALPPNMETPHQTPTIPSPLRVAGCTDGSFQSLKRREKRKQARNTLCW